MFNELQSENAARVNRRQFFGSAASGIGVAALASLLGNDASAKGTAALPGLPHHAAKAKRVVVLLAGWRPIACRFVRRQADAAPTSPAKTFPIPSVAPHDSRRCRPVMANGPAFPRSNRIKRTASAEQMLSEHAAQYRRARGRHLCCPQYAYRSGQSRAGCHALHDRRANVPGRPSMGAWLSVTVSAARPIILPTFVVLTSSDKGKTCGQLFFDYYWGSGFLPSRFQGVRFRNTGDLVPYLNESRQA
jgi:hypothetical protein